MAYKDLKTKKDKIQYLKDKLGFNLDCSIEGLMLIHGYQTPEELCASDTVEDNGVGFNAFDGSILTDIANKINSYGMSSLSDSEVNILFRRMPKYAKQITVIAEANKLY